MPDETPRDTAPLAVRALPAAVAAVGLVLLGTGLWQSLRPRTVGWFAYAPLTETVYAPGTAHLWVPVACVAVGALMLGAAAGWALGRRAARRA